MPKKTVMKPLFFLQFQRRKLRHTPRAYTRHLWNGNLYPLSRSKSGQKQPNKQEKARKRKRRRKKKRKKKNGPKKKADKSCYHKSTLGHLAKALLKPALKRFLNRVLKHPEASGNQALLKLALNGQKRKRAKAGT